MNKNGFVLAEAIVVSIFVIGMVAYIAVNMLPLIAKYEQVSNYDDLQGIYLVNDLYDDIKVRNIIPETGIYKFSGNDVGSISNIGDDVNCSKVVGGESVPGAVSFCDAVGFKTFIYKYLNIDEIVIGNVSDSNKSKLSRSMREYYNYYVSNYKPKNDSGVPDALTSNEMLVRFQDNTFANITMK